MSASIRRQIIEFNPDVSDAVDYQAIVRQLVQGRSYSEIVASLNCSRRGISAVSKVLASHGLTTVAQVEEVTPNRRPLELT